MRAAQHDGQISAHHLAGTGGREDRIHTAQCQATRLRVNDELLRFIQSAAFRQICPQRRGVRGRKEHIHPGEAFSQGSRVTHPDHAPHQRQDTLRVSLLDAPELVQAAHGLILRLLAHHASVEEHHVGFFRARHGRVAQTLQPRRDPL